MGTKLQPKIDLLAGRRLVILSKRGDSMEGTIEQRRVDDFKTTILKQEEVFKQQVRELHRLYSVQRMLMEEVKKERTQKSKPSRVLTSPGGFDQSESCSGGDSETRVNAKRSFGFEFDIVRAGSDHQEDNSRPCSSCSTMKPSSSRVTGKIQPELEDELCGLDLTLSIGGGDKKRLKDSPTIL